MIEPGFAAIKVGSAVGGPAIGFVMQQLEDGEREQIRESFAQALEWSLASEKNRTASSKGGARRVIRRVGSGLGRVGKPAWSLRSPGARRQRKAEVVGEKEVHDAIMQGAADLTKAWTEGSPKIVPGRSDETENWIAVLRDCVEATAREGTTPTNKDHAGWWCYLVTGDWDQNPTNPEIHEWARKVVKQTVMLWNSKRKLANVVAQLNVESGLGLQKALVVSSQRISRSLRWIALSAATLIVVGGGGIALLVLFLDKG